MCGKDYNLVVLQSSIAGSPPRVREGHKYENSEKSRKRITPRVCGKDSILSEMHVLISGSPPRVREGLFGRTFWRTISGITPACAGRTQGCILHSQGSQDHPRVCGKDVDVDVMFKTVPGSPPRVREGLVSASLCSIITRITPACAGRT